MIKFKNEEDQIHILYMSPKLGEVLLDMYQFFKQGGYEFVITSIIRSYEENKRLGAKSTSHCEGRAVDIRANHVDYNFTKDFVTYFNHKYSNVAAISASTGQPRLVVAHGQGMNFHFHVQLSPKYSTRYAQSVFKQGEEENGQSL